MTATATAIPVQKVRRRDHPPIRRIRQSLAERTAPYLYIAPFFVLFALVGLFPLVYTFVVSLNNWNLLTGPGEWVGFANYLAELNDPFFWNSLFNTVSIFLLSAIPQLIGAVFIAAMLDQNIRAKTFWRMSVLLPYVVTPVAVTLIFSSAFDEKYGLGFPLLADEDHAVAEAYEVWTEKSMYGRKYMGILRSAFLIDEKGKIAEAWYKVSPKDTPTNLLKALA